MSVDLKRRNGMGSHEHANYGASVEWYTPPEIFEALALVFDLDPCAPEGGPPSWVPVRRHLTLNSMGSMAPWSGRVWLNPPYGPGVDSWLGRLVDHGDGIAIVFARTDTAWFHRYAPTADALCFIRGRLNFVRRDGARGDSNAGAPSLLMAWGQECAEALERSGLGLTLRPQDPARFANPQYRTEQRS